MLISDWSSDVCSSDLRHQGEGAHFAFAGHLDVVPPGNGWSTDPFEATQKGSLLYGRGAVDMKGSIACFVAALARATELPGTISLIITGDEEGSAVHGTLALIDRMADRDSSEEHTSSLQ